MRVMGERSFRGGLSSVRETQYLGQWYSLVANGVGTRDGEICFRTDREGRCPRPVRCLQVILKPAEQIFQFTGHGKELESLGNPLPDSGSTRGVNAWSNPIADAGRLDLGNRGNHFRMFALERGTDCNAH